MNKEIIKIKAGGKLIAICPGWQYWYNDGAVYSIRSDGLHYNMWCDVSSLARHLHRLYQVTGKKYFTESDGMTVIDAAFIKRYAYA